MGGALWAKPCSQSLGPSSHMPVLSSLPARPQRLPMPLPPDVLPLWAQDPSLAIVRIQLDPLITWVLFSLSQIHPAWKFPCQTAEIIHSLFPSDYTFRSQAWLATRWVYQEIKSYVEVHWDFYCPWKYEGKWGSCVSEQCKEVAFC